MDRVSVRVRVRVEAPIEYETPWYEKGPWRAACGAVVWRPTLLKIFATISK